MGSPTLTPRPFFSLSLQGEGQGASPFFSLSLQGEGQGEDASPPPSPQPPRPPKRRTFTQVISRLLLRLLGWKADIILPDWPKYVLIGAPHTSNMDFFLMLFLIGISGLKLNWLGKDSLFRKPIGGIMRKLGGIPVNRRASTRFVDQMVAAFNENDELALVIAPEGTRSKVHYWKTGFYYIAVGAGVPIVFAYVDAARKTTGIGPGLMPTGDLQADFAQIKAFYDDKVGIRPEHQGQITLRQELLPIEILSDSETIRTGRLALQSLTVAQLHAYLDDPHILEQELGFPVSRGMFTEIVRGAIERKIVKMKAANVLDHAWFTYWLLIVPGQASQSFGAGLLGFKGLPDPTGQVEIGYGIDPKYQRQGYTTEGVRALVVWAFQDPRCKAIIAPNTAKDNPASNRVLAKVGMIIEHEGELTNDWRLDKR